MTEALIPLGTMRWARKRDDTFNTFRPFGRLQQAFRRPGSDIIVWQDVPEIWLESEDSSSTTEAKS